MVTAYMRHSRNTQMDGQKMRLGNAILFPKALPVKVKVTSKHNETELLMQCRQPHLRIPPGEGVLFTHHLPSLRLTP